jgi:trehalose 6-phosphate phosphatase
VSTPRWGADGSDDPIALAHRVAARVDDTRRPIIALDNDGTLSPIAPTPDAAELAPGARTAIAALCACADVVVISGRGLDDLAGRFLGLPIAIVSEHGLRHRAADGEVRALAEGLDASVLSEARAAVRRILDGEHPGWLVEDKGVSIAVHHRSVPAEEHEPTLTLLRQALEDIAGENGAIQTGKQVVELRPRGADKGEALRAVHAERRGALVVMVGDDVTDEAALAYAEGSGGVGVLVAEQPRPSAASSRLRDPEAVVAFLRQLGDELAGRVRRGR